VKYTITREYRQFIKELREEKKVSTLDITAALGKKSTATYNNIETEGLKNSLKNVELETIYKIFSSIVLRSGEKAYSELTYEEKKEFSSIAVDLISKFQEKGLDKNLQAQNWLIAFQLEYVLYEIPQEIQDIFNKFKNETGLSDKGFILELNKNHHLLSVRGFKELNKVEVKSDIEDNYVSWGVKYGFSENEAEELANHKELTYPMIYALLFNAYYSKSKNKGEVTKAISDVMKRNGIYIFPDYIITTNANTQPEQQKQSKAITNILDQISRYEDTTENAEQILEKIAKNMETDSFIELMSNPMFATMVHFTAEKTNALNESITKLITELLMS